jgi:hypothetical protein
MDDEVRDEDEIKSRELFNKEIDQQLGPKAKQEDFDEQRGH